MPEFLLWPQHRTWLQSPQVWPTQLCRTHEQAGLAEMEVAYTGKDHTVNPDWPDTVG